MKVLIHQDWTVPEHLTKPQIYNVCYVMNAMCLFQIPTLKLNTQGDVFEGILLGDD